MRGACRSRLVLRPPPSVLLVPTHAPELGRRRRRRARRVRRDDGGGVSGGRGLRRGTSAPVASTAFVLRSPSKARVADRLVSARGLLFVVEEPTCCASCRPRRCSAPSTSSCADPSTRPRTATTLSRDGCASVSGRAPLSKRRRRAAVRIAELSMPCGGADRRRRNFGEDDGACQNLRRPSLLLDRRLCRPGERAREWEAVNHLLEERDTQSLLSVD